MSQVQSKKKNAAFKSKWVWAILGLFATIFVVNYGFISVALNTNPGLVTEEYYKYGLQQNKIGKQYRKQEARGWQVQLNFNPDWAINQAQLIQLVVTDQYSQTISGGQAELTAYRPSDAKADVAISLVETAETGIYEAQLSLPIQGVWDMNVLFRKGEEKHMLNQRIVIQGKGKAEPSMLEKVVQFIVPE
ncbi:MAG: FixH family protein [Mariprofundaceae bacterium]|nr:FixH family protein [Mariprofundaceae bacterium]